jgi:hypothetical protein
MAAGEDGHVGHGAAALGHDAGQAVPVQAGQLGRGQGLGQQEGVLGQPRGQRGRAGEPTHHLALDVPEIGGTFRDQGIAGGFQQPDLFAQGPVPGPGRALAGGDQRPGPVQQLRVVDQHPVRGEDGRFRPAAALAGPQDGRVDGRGRPVQGPGQGLPLQLRPLPRLGKVGGVRGQPVVDGPAQGQAPGGRHPGQFAVHRRAERIPGRGGRTRLDRANAGWVRASFQRRHHRVAGGGRIGSGGVHLHLAVLFHRQSQQRHDAAGVGPAACVEHVHPRLEPPGGPGHQGRRPGMQALLVPDPRASGCGTHVLGAVRPGRAERRVGAIAQLQHPVQAGPHRAGGVPGHRVRVAVFHHQHAQGVHPVPVQGRQIEHHQALPSLHPVAHGDLGEEPEPFQLHRFQPHMQQHPGPVRRLEAIGMTGPVHLDHRAGAGSGDQAMVRPDGDPVPEHPLGEHRVRDRFDRHDGAGGEGEQGESGTTHAGSRPWRGATRSEVGRPDRSSARGRLSGFSGMIPVEYQMAGAVNLVFRHFHRLRKKWC